MKPDLNEVTTDELIAELESRSRAIVLGMDPPADQGYFRVIVNGSRVAGVGLVRALAVMADSQLKASLVERLEPPTPNA